MKKTYVIVEIQDGCVRAIHSYGPADIQVIELDWDDLETEMIQRKISEVHEVIIANETDDTQGVIPEGLRLIGRLKEALADIEVRQRDGQLCQPVPGHGGWLRGG